MNTYLITLQLKSPENTHAGLLTYLKSGDNWARPMSNVWIIQTSMDAGPLRDGIKAKITPGDKLMVVRLKDGFWATQGVTKEVTDWMQSNL